MKDLVETTFDGPDIIAEFFDQQMDRVVVNPRDRSRSPAGCLDAGLDDGGEFFGTESPELDGLKVKTGSLVDGVKFFVGSHHIGALCCERLSALPTGQKLSLIDKDDRVVGDGESLPFFGDPKKRGLRKVAPDSTHMGRLSAAGVSEKFKNLTRLVEGLYKAIHVDHGQACSLLRGQLPEWVSTQI